MVLPDRAIEMSVIYDPHFQAVFYYSLRKGDEAWKSSDSRWQARREKRIFPLTDIALRNNHHNNKMKKTKEIRPMPDDERSFSWSAISSFKYSKEQWWNKYVLHQKCTYENHAKGTHAFCFIAGFADPECPVVKKTIELEFGSMIDDKIQKDKKFIPSLPRYRILQHEMRCELNGIKLVGIADAFEFVPSKEEAKNFGRLRDYKTGRVKWDQKRADETGQLTMYCFLLWKINKIRPEDMELWIDWLPTHTKDGKIEFVDNPVKPVSFRTKRTMKQVLEFGNYIMEVHSEMYQYAMNRPVLDTHSYDEF